MMLMIITAHAPSSLAALIRACRWSPQERNWDLRWDEARQTLTELLEQSVPFIHKEGDLRREDINNIVTGLGHNAPFKVTKMVH